MTGSIRPRRRPAGRLFVLLVLAVLAGVLGMHALGPGGTQTAERPTGMARGHDGAAPTTQQAPAVQPPVTPHAPAAHPPGEQVPVAVPAGEACAHTDGGSGHLAHADRTCAAAGTASGYAPPALADALPGVPAAAGTPAAGPAPAVWGRAPPDLSELQLLRI